MSWKANWGICRNLGFLTEAEGDWRLSDWARIDESPVEVCASSPDIRRLVEVIETLTGRALLSTGLRHTPQTACSHRSHSFFFILLLLNDSSQFRHHADRRRSK